MPSHPKTSAVAWVVMGDELRARLHDDARLQAEALAAELDSGGAEELTRQIRAMAAFGDDHGTLYSFLPAGGGKVAGNMTLAEPFEGPRRLVAGRDMTLLPDPGSQEGEAYFAWGIRSPAGWIVVARDSQWVADSEEVLIQSIAWGLGVALVATVLLAFAVGRRDARRVSGINQVLAAVAQGDLTARYPVEGRGRDDLSQVAEGINRMLERLEANVERLAQVSADITHDLRSPLTRLRLRLEPQALRDDLPEDTRAAIAASLESSIRSPPVSMPSCNCRRSRPATWRLRLCQPTCARSPARCTRCWSRLPRMRGMGWRCPCWRARWWRR